MDLGTTIKNIRNQKKLTQQKLAALSGITQTYLSQIEGNLKDPNLATLKDISNVLNVPLPIIFFLSIRKDDVPPHKREAFEIVNPSIQSLVNEFFAV